jgi:PE-PPE domain
MKRLVGLLVAVLLVGAAPVAEADTVIFVQGTNNANPFDPPNPAAAQFAQLFQGSLNTAGTTVVLLNYPASLGWLSWLKQGVGSPTVNESVAVGVQNLDASNKAARAADPTGQIDVVGLSQGSIVGLQEAFSLLAQGYDTSGIKFTLAGNPVRPNGGLATRLPFPATIPGVLTVGGTELTTPPPSTGVQVVEVTNQFDPFADAPAYLLKPVAVANWLVALAVALAGSHRPPLLSNQHGYASTTPTDPTAIVTTSGNLTDVLIPSPVGQLPLTQPLFNLGVPQAFVTAIDPFLRAVIMTAYRPTNDPAQRVTFELLPPVSAWGPDIASIAAGAAETRQLLKKAVLGSRPAPAPPVDHPDLASILNSGLPVGIPSLLSNSTGLPSPVPMTGVSDIDAAAGQSFGALNSGVPVSISSVPSPLYTQTPSVNASTTSPRQLAVANIAEPPASTPQSMTNPDVTVASALAPKAQEPDATTGDEQPVSDPKVGSGTDSWATTPPSLSTRVAIKPPRPQVHLPTGSNLPRLKATRPSPDRPMRSVLNGLKRGPKAPTTPSGSASTNSRDSSGITQAVRKG